MVIALLDTAGPLLTKRAIDAATGGTPNLLPGIAGTLVLLALALFGLTFGRRYLAALLSLRVQHDLRTALLAAVHRMDGPQQDGMRTGQVVSRSISDLQLVQGLLAMVPLACGAAVQFALALVVMTVLSPPLTAVALLVLPLIGLVVYRVRPRLFAATWSAQQRAADLAQHVEETVTGVRVVKGFGQEDRMVDRLADLGRDLYAERMRAARLNARFAPSLATLPMVGLLGVIVAGGGLALRGSISIGTFVAFAAYVSTMAATVRLLSSLIITAQLARAGIERVYQVIDTEPRTRDPARPVPLPAGPLGVEFDRVCFGFDPDQPVLTDLDLRVAPGETVALVGPAGSGKTALALLVERFYRPDSGTVALRSGDRRIDLADLQADDLRGAIGFVSDDPFLLSDTITTNIALGRPDAGADEIARVAAIAAVDRFVAELPDGFDTVVGERGLTLSGGQRQRIALARALLLRPRILVLDDATSALDTETEAAIFDALRSDADRSGAAPPTTILISHRDSTLDRADRVVRLTGPEHAVPAAPSAVPTRTAPAAIGFGGPAGSAGSAGSALSGLAPTPTITARVARLPPATEQPKVDTARLRRGRRVFRPSGLLRPVRGLLVGAIALLAVNALISVAYPTIARHAVDAGVLAGDAGALWLAGGFGLGLAVVDWSAGAASTVITARTGERVLFGLRVRSYAHLQRLGLDYYERELSGRIMTRMTTDVDALSTFIQTGLAVAVISALTVLGVSVALLATDATLALVVLATLPPLAAATWLFRRVSVAAYTASRERISIVNADFQENVAGLRTLQAYRREEFAARGFAARSMDYLRARMRAQRAIAGYFPLVTLLSNLAAAAVVLVGGYRVASGTTSAGTLVAFILYLTLLFGPVMQLSQVFDGYQQARVGLRRIAELLATRSSIEEAVDAADAVTVTGSLTGAARLDRVHFRYAGAAVDALAGIDLDVPAGSTVALVGRTGAGKSTIVKLLARFYDPTTGRVRVDDVDIRRFPLAQYRARLGVVPQEAHLFTGDVASNIAFGRPDATPAQIEAAAAAVGALDVLSRLPAGLAQPVGERGQGLSAGQRQLVALARAELVDPDLLLLDEATATLDPATEASVLTASRTVTGRRTAVIVAHRLATAARADRIVVVDNGRVVESGSHDQLLTAAGPYARLWAVGTWTRPDHTPGRGFDAGTSLIAGPTAVGIDDRRRE
ncbi:ABC transporter ATP-binding protein [Skermania piniformis]